MNKPSKIFAITSGMYVFLLTFLLLNQSRNGYEASAAKVFMYFALYVPLWILIAGVVFIASKNTEKNWYETVFGKRTLFFAILLSVLISFVFNLDYQRQVGCFGDDQDLFSPLKFVFSIGSILFLSAGYYFSGNKFGVSLLIMEFFIWTFKSLYFSSSLDLFLPGYFIMCCWILRVAFIFKVLNNTTK